MYVGMHDSLARIIPHNVRKANGAVGERNEGLRLTFHGVAFNTIKAGFKFSILLQLCFYAPKRVAGRTVSVQPKTGTNSHQRLRAHGSNQKKSSTPSGTVHHVVQAFG